MEAAGPAVLAALIVAAGTALQATVGFGLALVAAPLLILIDPVFVPGPVIASALVLTLRMVWREWSELDWEGIGPALAGRVIGTPPAAWLVGALSGAAFDLFFGLLVLAGVGLSLVHPRIEPTRRTVFCAAVVSSFMGTASSIGGPPLALVYQHASGPRLRATLAALFVMGCVVSLSGLAVVGRFGAEELLRSAVLLPGVLLGLWLSRPLLARLEGRSVRPLVLGLSSAAGGLVLARALL